MSFGGFGVGACAFFADLAANNERDWFKTSKATFETEVKAPMEALLAAAQARFGGEIKVFRQNRDTRFSKDKSPYKTAIYGGVYDAGRVMGWYAMLDAREFFAGMGVYQMPKAQLGRYRDAVAGDAGAALADAVAGAEAAGLILSGGGGKGAPRGYPKDHPRVDLLRRKAIILGARIDGSRASDGGAVWSHAVTAWEAAAPVARWLDAEVGA